MTSFIDVLNNVADVWWPYVFHGAWQAAVVGITILVVLRFTKRWPATLRHALVFLALLKFLVPPLASLPSGLLSQIEIPADEQQAPASVTASDALDMQESGTPQTNNSVISMEVGEGENLRKLVEQAAAQSEHNIIETEVPEAPVGTRPIQLADSGSTLVQPSRQVGIMSALRLISWQSWLMVVYGAGATLVVFAAIFRMRTIRRIIGTATSTGIDQPETLQNIFAEATQILRLKRTPQIVASPEVDLAFSVGILNPAVVLPQTMVESLNPQELRTVLLHELIHHKRADLWITWLQFIVSMLWWFHPVVWLVNRAIRDTREDCCDDTLLTRNLVTDADYCDTLVKVTRHLQKSRRIPMALAVSMADRHPFTERITRIMDDRITRTDRLSVVGIVAIVVCGFLLLPGLHSGVEVAATMPVEESPAPADDGSTVDVVGRLTDERGLPVSGADVWLSVEERWESSWEGPPVVAHAMTDGDGHFILQPLQSDVDLFVESQSTRFQLWAFKPGYQLTRTFNNGALWQQAVELTLDRVPTTTVQVKYPDGSVAPETAVTINYAEFKDGAFSSIPEAVRRSTTVTSDTGGNVQLDLLDRIQIRSLLLENKASGMQSCAFRIQKQANAMTLRIHESGSIHGRLVVPAGVQEDLSTVTIRIATLNPIRPDQAEVWSGTAIVRPDREGHFVVPALAEGRIRVFVTEPDGFPYRSEMTSEGLSVSPGETSELVIPLRKAVRVTRLIRDAKSKQSIPGIRVNMQHNHQHISARTDANGQFTAFLLPGVLYNTVYDLPDGYLQQNINSRTTTNVPNGVQEHTLKPIDVLQSRTIEGIVRDANGDAFPGVRVGANWSDSDEDFGFMAASGFSARAWATTDADGHFRLTGGHPAAAISLTPVRAGLVLGSTVNVPASEAHPVELSTEPFDFVSLNGRVINQEATPVGGMRYSIQVAINETQKENPIFGLRGRTDATGNLATPAHLPQRYSYRIKIKQQDNATVVSPWIVPMNDGTTFPDITIASVEAPPTTDSPSRILERTIIDDEGNPVSQARVTVWYEGNRRYRLAATDGRFIFRDVPPAGTWLFVQADGFRFHGEYAASDSEDSQIVLTRRNEPAAAELPPIESRPVSEAVLKLAQTEFRKFVDVVLNTEGDSGIEMLKANAHLRLADFDPDSALALIGDSRFHLSKINFSSDDDLT